MQRINKTLNAAVKKYKIEDKVRAQSALKHWERVVGELLPKAAQRTMAVSLEKGILRVVALSKELAFEIRMFQQRLMEALNKMIGKRLVFVIVCEF